MCVWLVWRSVGLSRQVGWQEQRLEGWGRRSPLTDAYVRMVDTDEYTEMLGRWYAGGKKSAGGIGGVGLYILWG